MAFDAHKNLAISAVATAPSPATSGTSLVVTAGQGARFPAVPFYVTVWAAGTVPDPSNAEIVRVTAVSTDTFTITRATRTMLSGLEANGNELPFQPHMATENVCTAFPASTTTTVDSWGFTSTANGTATLATPASTNIRTAARRIMYASSTTAGNSCGWRQNGLIFWSGNAAGLGGFHFICRFAIAQTQTNWRFALVMSATNAALSNADPSSFLSFVGIIKDGADTTFQVAGNDASGTATKQNTSLTPSTTTIYEGRIYISPNGSTYGVSLTDIGAGTTFDTTVSASGDKPANTSFLAPQLWMNNNAQAAAVQVELISAYAESVN